MATEIRLQTDDKELGRVLSAGLKTDANKAELAELRKLAQADPARVNRVYGLARVVEQTIIDRISGSQKGVNILTRANVEALRLGMGYEQAPMIERLLIDNICVCWLRLQWTECQLSNQVSTYTDGEYWEKRVSASQRRYLRAVETLARVRKMSLPALQVNIASEGGQQVNIAGDLIKR